ncbi:prepilin-type N-terminal cleavage/methylation domain-containing protein [Terrimicrobium sacchariphilum]|uniref:Prepilin-type N-terminal cleavage/methylation domain-containing protein n=1 Tax=Terrimicrobium sacchariphilum TaxID=690879 RepID=A0A146G3H0_TERSA|nr:prepilin-type N-terminal cleavage/methylation domain-containing protein [Terrimicrobium sacchariphilum]GAT32200.1 prepilin-type N-terminal cleavage/methylation domain-containing protein [Terrimicrobium sacchariphilum]
MKRNAGAFTLVEVLLVVSVLAILSGAAYQGVVQVRKSARENKLQQDVDTINRAIPIYQTFDGQLSPNLKEEAVIAQLKTRRTDSSAAVAILPGGSVIDQRIHPVMQTAAEAATTDKRAVWTGTIFEVRSGPGPAGVKEFEIQDNLAKEAPVDATERKELLAQVHDVKQGPGWIWDYRDLTPEEAAALTNPNTSNPTSTPTPSPAPSASPTPDPAKIAIHPMISGPTEVTYAAAGGQMASGAATVSVFLTGSVVGTIPANQAGKVTVTLKLEGGSAGGTDAAPATMGISTSAFAGITTVIGTASLDADPNAFVISGNPDRQSVAIKKVTLGTPLITAVQGMNTSFFVSPGDLANLPAGYILRYSTDGSDLESPSAGQAYTSAVPLAEDAITTIKARTFAPASLTNWFFDSAQTTQVYTPVVSPSTIPKGVLVGSLSALNGTFNGNIMLAYSPTPSNIQINSGGKINGSLYLPGTPTVKSNAVSGGDKTWTPARDSLFASVILGQNTYDNSPYRVVDLGGPADPSNYTVNFDPAPSVTGKVYRQIERYTLTAFDLSQWGTKASNAPTAFPVSGTYTYAATSNADITVNSGTPTVNLIGGTTANPQAGHFGSVSLNSGTLVLGNASDPNQEMVYYFDSLTLNGGTIQVVGKVTINLKGGFNLGRTIGNSAHPGYLQLNIWSGSFNANSGSAVYGAVYAPSSTVTFNGGSTLNGSITANKLNMNSSSVIYSLKPPTEP